MIARHLTMLLVCASMLASPMACQQNQKAAQETAPAVSATAIKQLLAKLDTHFSNGAVDKYLGEFEPDHEGSLAMLGRHLERLLRLGGQQPTRTSNVVAGPRSMRDRTIVRVRHQMQWAPAKAAAGAPAGKPRILVEDSYIALRVADDGRLVPTLSVDMPPKVNCVTEDKFRCPPCNYEIGGVDGFMCVPLRREQALALESASFYLVGTDLVCEVHVRLEPGQVAKEGQVAGEGQATSGKVNAKKSAKAVVQQLASALAKIEPSAKVGIPSAWLPPMHKKSPPASLDAARVTVALPKDQPERGGRVTIFHVVSFGGLQHVLLIRSSKDTLRKHQDAVDELFRSYMLLEVDCDEAALASLPLRIHTGSMFDGPAYHNVLYDVEMHGPDGWHPEHRSGGAAFRIRWRGPNGSQMWLIGHRVPAGMDGWTSETADRWLMHQCNRQALQPDEQFAATSAAQWHKTDSGAACRTSVLNQNRPKQPNTPRRRILHVQVHEDLLLVVDGTGGTQADEAAIRAAIATLQRN